MAANPTPYTQAAEALEAIESATEARNKMKDAYTNAFDEFTEVEQAYRKFFGIGVGKAGIVDLVKKYGPTALKYFGAGGAGAGVLLSLTQDGTGAGILSKIGGIFGIGGS